ncbi:MAG: hypothetical protein AB7O66_07555 [Limisphaerales bacterium]
MPLRFREVLDQLFVASGAKRRGGRLDRVPGHRSGRPEAFLGLQADPGYVAERLTQHEWSLAKPKRGRNGAPMLSADGVIRNAG